MRVALDCTLAAGPIGQGLGVYARHLAAALARVAGESDQFDLAYEARKWRVRSQGVPELDHRFKHRKLWPVPFRVGWSARVDLFHGLEARLPRARFAREIVTFHDMYPYHRYLWAGGTPTEVRYHEKRLVRYPAIAARAAAIICDSQNTRDDLLRVVPWAEPKVTVIHLGTDAGAPGAVAGEGEVPAAVRGACRGRYFVHVGSMWRIRNLPATVRAFARVARAQPDVRLVLVGQPGEDSPKVAELVGSLGLERSVAVLGPLPEREKLHVVSRAAALLMFHLYAGFGLPVAEAMALGVPVLGSDRGAIPEVGGDAGIWVGPDDEAGMAAAMERVLSDQDLARGLARNGLARARRFTWEATARATYDVYRSLDGKR